MPITAEEVRETRAMRLISRALGDAGPLPRFLAARRQPGTKWQTWESIAVEIQTHTGELITREGLHKWAVRYGIPDTTRTDNPATYRSTVQSAGISI